jgi:hypothetical protein
VSDCAVDWEMFSIVQCICSIGYLLVQVHRWEDFSRGGKNLDFNSLNCNTNFNSHNSTKNLTNSLTCCQGERENVNPKSLLPTGV